MALGPKLLAVVLFLVSGSISTLAFKLQGSQVVEEGGLSKKFFHPYMQSFLMFLGEGMCIVLYAFSLRGKKQAPLQAGKTPHHFYYFAIPASSDAISSMLQYMGLNFITGSTYLMFKGCSIVTTAVFSKILFGMVLQKRHFVGCGAAVLGLVIVGSSSFLEPASSHKDMGRQVTGYVIMLISLVFNGFYYAYEQLLIRRHSIDPLQMVGCEGCFGMLIVMLVSLVLSLVPCSLGEKYCAYDPHGYGYFERVDQFWRELGTHWFLGLLSVVGTISVGAYNLNGVRITKLIDALTRSLLNITKTSIIWVVGIILTFALNNDDYRLESRSLWVNLVKAGGFVGIIIGTLIYNQLIFKEYFKDKTEAVPPIQEGLVEVNSLIQSADDVEAPKK